MGFPGCTPGNPFISNNMPNITKTMAFDSAPDEVDSSVAPEESDQPTTDQEPDANEPGESSEGETLSLDVFCGKEPTVGQMVTLKVTAVDPENGTVSVMMPAVKKMGGIAKQAAMLDEGPA